MDIGSILSQAGGAGAIARELGVDEATVERGAGALVPEVATGIETKGLPSGAGDPQIEPPQGGVAGGFGGLGGILSGMMGGAGSSGILGSLIAGGAGNQILGHIFGSKDTSREVAEQASRQSGVDTSVLKKLLPIVAGAVAMHYVTHRKGGSAAGSGPSDGGGGLLGSILGGTGGLKPRG